MASAALAAPGVRRTGRPANLDQELARLGALPLRAGREYRVDDAHLAIRVGERLRRYPLPLPARLGSDNLATACQALAAAGLPPSPDLPHRVADTGLVGRCQVRRWRGAQCVLDVGHNLEALTRLRERLPLCAGRRRVVIGMMADKPVEAALGLLAERPADWYLARPDLPRAAQPRASPRRCRTALPGACSTASRRPWNRRWRTAGLATRC